MPRLTIEIGSRADQRRSALNRRAPGRPAPRGSDVSIGARPRRRSRAPYDGRRVEPDPTSRRTTPCCWSPSAGPEKPEDVVPFLENVTRGRGIPRERLEEVGRALLPLRGPLADQRPEPRRCSPRSARTSPAHGIDLPVYWGNRNWDPYLADAVAQMTADGVTRAACFVTSAYSSYSGAGSTARTSPTPSPRSSGAPAARQAAALLQPPGLRRAGGRRDARRAGRARRRRPRGRAPGVRHPLDPDGDERRAAGRDGGAYVAQHRDVAAVGRRAGRGRRPAAGTRTTWSSARAPGRRTCRGSSPTSTTTSRSSPAGRRAGAS